MYASQNAGCGFLLNSMFDFAERFNELQLTDEEVALFSALIIISAGIQYTQCYVCVCLFSYNMGMGSIASS